MQLYYSGVSWKLVLKIPEKSLGTCFIWFPMDTFIREKSNDLSSSVYYTNELWEGKIKSKNKCMKHGYKHKKIKNFKYWDITNTINANQTLQVISLGHGNECNNIVSQSYWLCKHKLVISLKDLWMLEEWFFHSLELCLYSIGQDLKQVAQCLCFMYFNKDIQRKCDVGDKKASYKRRYFVL